MKTILLTGVAGFIASKVAEILIKSNYRVVGVDNLNDYYDVRLKEHRLQRLVSICKEAGAGLKNSFHFIKADIEDFQHIETIFNEFCKNGNSIEAVINLAARAGVRYSMENPHVYLSTNATGTLNLLELMRKYKVMKIILASTSSLYAGQEMPFNEELPVNTPISPYAASKKAAEVMCYTYHYLYGIDVSVLRYFTVYGPAGRPDMCIFRFIKWIDDGKAITLFGDGEQTRDFTYVDDIAEGTIRALMPLGFQVINLGGGRGHTSLLYVIKKIEELLGKKAIIENKPFHKTDLKDTMADIEKAKRMLNGWTPLVTVEEGISKSVEWYKNNKDLVKNITL